MILWDITTGHKGDIFKSFHNIIDFWNIDRNTYEYSYLLYILKHNIWDKTLTKWHSLDTIIYVDFNAIILFKKDQPQHKLISSAQGHYAEISQNLSHDASLFHYHVSTGYIASYNIKCFALKSCMILKQ